MLMLPNYLPEHIGENTRGLIEVLVFWGSKCLNCIRTPFPVTLPALFFQDSGVC